MFISIHNFITEIHKYNSIIKKVHSPRQRITFKIPGLPVRFPVSYDNRLF